MYKLIHIEDVFDRYCEYIQCKHNDNAYCIRNECLSEYIKYHKGYNMAECIAFEPKSGYCECGRKLKKCVDYYPYGDTNAPYEYYSCDNC